MVKLYENGKSRKDLVREYNLSATTLDNWIKKHQNTGSFSAKDNRTEENELIKLRKENQRLLMENDI